MSPSLHPLAARSLCSGEYQFVDEHNDEFVFVEFEDPAEDYLLVPATSRSKTGWKEDFIASTARLWKLTDVETSELRELGRRLEDVDHLRNTPGNVLRFLRARDGNLQAAEDMFRKMVAWRIANNVDKILQDYRPPQEMIDFFPGALLVGVDKEKDPIWVSRIGSTDTAGMLNRYGKEEMVRQAIWIRETAFQKKYLEQYEREQGRPFKRMTIIEDVGGLNLMQFLSNKPLISAYGEIARLDQDYYPESAKRLVIIRVPGFFKMIWNVVKHFFDAGVVEKMVFCGNHYEKVLSKYIDLEVLPDAIVPGIGKGKATEGMPPNFHGGPLPPLKGIP